MPVCLQMNCLIMIFGRFATTLGVLATGGQKLKTDLHIFPGTELLNGIFNSGR